ncbi:tripartite motif-containing protein 3-like [Centruroides vittatus]|uniref:tripartite motif-containing protein 3-like n=1 Tax=Centruroides vittatus TaxID=120091 RepID=UPI00350F2DD1
MENMSSERLEALVKEFNKSKQALRKVKNAKALIDKKYYIAKQKIEKAVEQVESRVLHNLEVIFTSQLEFLKNLEKEFENLSSPNDDAKTSEYGDTSSQIHFDIDNREIECCVELEFKAAKPASSSTLYSDTIENNKKRDSKYNYEDVFEDRFGTNENYKANEILLHDEKPENYSIIPSVNARLKAIISESSGIDLSLPVAIEVNCNNDIIICDAGHDLVWILDEYGRLKTSFQRARKGITFKNPSSVAATVDGNFVIRDDNGLYLFNNNGNYIKSFGEELLKNPLGLAVTESKKVITLDQTTNHLFVFNESGKLERSNIFEPLIIKPRNSNCRYMVSYSDEVALSDSGASRVYKTTLDGKLIKIFGSYGRAPGQMDRPSGIALDPKGAMFIAEIGNERIQVFDLEGHFLGRVTFSHQVRPLDIALTKDGRLYVLDAFDRRLDVYHLETDK